MSICKVAVHEWTFKDTLTHAQSAYIIRPGSLKNGDQVGGRVKEEGIGEAVSQVMCSVVPLPSLCLTQSGSEYQFSHA